MSPKETFTDDPLRVLRCIRFASRFGFTMVPELQDAAKDPQIQVCGFHHCHGKPCVEHPLQEALRVKISRERVGEELDKMMGGRLALNFVVSLVLNAFGRS